MDLIECCMQITGLRQWFDPLHLRPNKENSSINHILCSIASKKMV